MGVRVGRAPIAALRCASCCSLLHVRLVRMIRVRVSGLPCTCVLLCSAVRCTLHLPLPLRVHLRLPVLFVRPLRSGVRLRVLLGVSLRCVGAAAHARIALGKVSGLCRRGVLRPLRVGAATARGIPLVAAVGVVRLLAHGRSSLCGGRRQCGFKARGLRGLKLLGAVAHAAFGIGALSSLGAPVHTFVV